jgi:modulator of FtsH protease HflK
MVWGNENNRHQSPWDDEPQKQSKPANQQPSVEEFLRRSQFSFNDGFTKLKNNHSSGNSNKLIYMIIAIICAIWVSTGFYTVDEGEQALVIRFGKYERTAGTGLNYHLPEPIERIIKEKVETLRKEEIGFRTRSSSKNTYGNNNYNANSASNVAQESLMLTGDENIIDINFIAQWKISNLKDYVFNIYNSRETVRSVAESSMREVIGTTSIDKAITDGRSSIESETKDLVQKILNSYKSGVEITTLKLLKTDPPAEVIDAFRDVQTAKTDKERAINKAYAFHNEVLPKARGAASQIELDSEGYKKEIVERALGEAGRFDLIYTQYKTAKDLTKKRLYLESMENILQGIDKTIISNQKNTGIVPYLPLNQLDKK